MELIFEKVNEHRYEAYFEAPGDFNLHVERVKNGTLEVYQRGIAEGEYDFAWSAGVGARKVIDYDFAAFVYPKWIKVVSSSEVVSASVNFNEGGGSGSGSVDNVKYFAIGMDNIVATDFAPENLQTIFQYEEGMTFADWLISDYNTVFEPDSTNKYLTFIGGASAILRDNGFIRQVDHSEVIQSTVYMLYGDY